ncbi:aspartate/glutamate racemase family protein [Campylobacter blaseri]|uniref:Aspartate racemase n=1 Tax=Campylobacter blaseri TaxID=2042961 RepID=A0A2P8QZL3_9BACT|nr:aspartate/glutamate racemase family protein [Campylobacter blaseri]PSM51680.1 aspartate racemase [Campylobacter blaseri]PSM53470.1 aspartate racemase [Campylobacter blaseri]QKF86275.1 aspartate/glutamate racemase family protein [Campylobacter blaseri]
MKIIGLIGGMSWQSSLEYYKIINKTVEERLGGLHSAKCIMHSVDFEEIEILQHQGNWEELSKIMVEIAKKLKNSGADFILICTNTMHKLASDIENLAKIDVLHIAEAIGRAISQKKITKVGLLGTKFTMEGDFYLKILNEKFNIEVIIPTKEQRDIVHNIIYNELCKGIIKQSSKDEYIKIIKDLALNGANGIVLGCTEIPLLIKQEDVDTLVFDTTTLHAIEAVNFAISK